MFKQYLCKNYQLLDSEEIQVRYALPFGGGGDVQWLININSTLTESELKGLGFDWTGTLELRVNILHKFAVDKNTLKQQLLTKKKN